MRNPGDRRRKLWFWLGVILLSVSAFLWFACIAGAIENPELDLIDGIIGVAIFTFIPIGFGVYCVRRGRRPVIVVSPSLPITPVTDGDTVRERCQICARTDDLAQCLECRLWFCREHDVHECIPQIAHLQKQIKAAKIRSVLGDIIKWGALTVSFVGGTLIEFGAAQEVGWQDLALYLAILVAFVALGQIIGWHYNGRLRQLGVRVHGIRPSETAKKDR